MRGLLTFLIFLLMTAVGFADWESDFWSSQLKAAKATATTDSPSHVRARLLMAWSTDDPVSAIRELEKFLSVETKPEYLELYWHRGQSWLAEVGDNAAQVRLAESLKNRPKLEHMTAAILDSEASARLHLGQTDQAKALWGELKFIRDWRVLGPFSNTADSGFDNVLPPEEIGPLSGRFPGLHGQPLEWHKLNLVHLSGWAELEAFLGASSPATFYAVTSVQSPEPQDILVALEHMGAAKVWLNGKLLFHDAAYRPGTGRNPDLQKFPGQLVAGPNTILVKLASDQETKGSFRLRLLKEGEPTPLDLPTDSSKAKLGVRHADTSTPPVVDQRAAANKLPAGPEKELFLSLIEVNLGHNRPAADILEQARHAHPKSGWLGWFHYVALARSNAETEARAVRAEALGSGQGIPELEAHRITEIVDTEQRLAEARSLVQDFPHSPTAQATAGWAAYESGLTPEALGYMDAVVKFAPGSNYLRAYAEALRKLDRSAQALTLLQTHLKDRPGDTTLLRLAANLAGKQGQTGEALELYKKAESYGGTDGLLLMNQGKLLLKNDQAKAAVLRLQEAIAYAPQAYSLWEVLGDALREAGESDNAAEAFKSSLDFRPTSRVRGKLADVTGERPVSELVPPLDLAPILEQASKTDFDEGARMLLDEGRVIIFPDFSYEEHFQMIYEIKDQDTAENMQRIPRDFGGHTESFQVHRSMIVRPDGKEVDAREYVTASGFRFPSLAAGDRIEIDYVVRGRKGTGLEKAYWMNWYFTGQFPSLKNRLSVVTPKGMTYNFRSHGGAVEPTMRSEGDWVIRQWDMENIEALNLVGSTVPTSDLASWVDVSTVPDWKTIARWYAELSSDRCTADAKAKSKALELTKGLTSERDKIRVLRDFLARDLNYQTTPFRNSAFVPTEGAKVLEEGYGDCKDKAALLTAMLAEVGIKSRMALVSSRNAGLVPFLPSPRFSHAINVIETSQGPLWVDSTSSVLPYDQLHFSLYGTPALVVDPETNALITITPPPVARDHVESVVTANLEAKGALRGELRVKYQGNPAGSLRATLQRVDRSQREQVLQLALPRLLSGAKASSAKVIGLDDYDGPLSFVFEFEQPNAARAAGSFLIADLPWAESCRPKTTLNSIQNHTGGIEVGEARGTRTALTKITLPKGYEIAEGPKPTETSNAFGAFSLTRNQDAQVLEMRIESSLLPLRVQESEADGFVEFLEAHEKALDQPLILKKVP